MEELPLGIQLKLRELPGAESGVQVVDLILEDGRRVPEVRVVDCAYVEDDTFAAEMVADVRLPTAPPSTRRALVFLLLLVIGIVAMYFLLWAIVPDR